MGGKLLLNEVKRMYVNSLASIWIKGGESECLRINSGTGQGCIMYPWFFHVYMDSVIKEVIMKIGRMGETDYLDSSMMIWFLCG